MTANRSWKWKVKMFMRIAKQTTLTVEVLAPSFEKAKDAACKELNFTRASVDKWWITRLDEFVLLDVDYNKGEANAVRTGEPPQGAGPASEQVG